MDLVNLVQAVIEISKSREEYSDEVKKLKLQLDTLCSSLKDLDVEMIPYHLHQKLQTELKESLEMIEKLPKKAGLYQLLIIRLDVVRCKVPLMSNYIQDIKDKSKSLEYLSSILTHHLIKNIAIAQSQRQAPQLAQQPEKQEQVQQSKIAVTITQVDCTAVDDLPVHTGAQVQLKLIADEEIRNHFRAKLLNITEILPIPISQGEVKLHQFGRAQYLPLKGIVQQIETISGEHAILTCKSILKDKDQFVLPLPKSTAKTAVDSQQKQKSASSKHSEDVFYTCIDSDDVQQTDSVSSLQSDREYQFFLQNQGQMGVFLYKMTKSNELEADVWHRIRDKKKVQINNGDKIGILMKKPDYKQVLIGYEFIFM